MCDGHVALIHHRVFQCREPFRQDAYPIARADLDAALRRTEQYRIPRIQGSELAQGTQQFGGAALQPGGVPVVRFATVNFSDDGQVVHVVHGDPLPQRTKTVPAFGFDCRAIKALFRQAYLVGQRVPGDVGRCLFHADFAGRFAHHQRDRCATQHCFALRERDRFTCTDHRVVRLDKPHCGFRRGVVGGFFKRLRPGFALALVVQRHGKNSTFH